MQNKPPTCEADIFACLLMQPKPQQLIRATPSGRQKYLPYISRLLILFSACLACFGCASQKPLPEGSAPSDFCLVICVHTNTKLETEEAYGATFILEPDNMLRAATGPGCTLETYPDPTIQLSRTDVQKVYDLTRELDFNQRPKNTSHGSFIHIQVVVVANGQKKQVTVSYNMDEFQLGPGEPEPIAKAIRLVDLLHKKCGIKFDGKR